MWTDPREHAALAAGCDHRKTYLHNGARFCISCHANLGDIRPRIPASKPWCQVCVSADCTHTRPQALTLPANVILGEE